MKNKYLTFILGFFISALIGASQSTPRINNIKQALFDIRSVNFGYTDPILAGLLLLTFSIEAFEMRKPAISYLLHHPEELTTKEKKSLLRLLAKKFQFIVHKIEEIEAMFRRKGKNAPHDLWGIFNNLKLLLNGLSEYKRHQVFYYDLKPMIASGIALASMSLVPPRYIPHTKEGLIIGFLYVWLPILLGSTGVFLSFLQKYAENKIVFSPEEEQLWQRLIWPPTKKY